MMLKFKGFWEYYFLRYFVGTVVGAAIIVVSPSCRVALERLIPGGAEWRYLVALPALGLAYCYVASAPMLTLHVVRTYLFEPSSPGASTDWELQPAWMLRMLWRWIAVLVVASTVALAVRNIKLVPGLFHGLCDSMLSAIEFVFYTFVVAAQMYFIVRAYRDRFARVTAFYWKLAGARGANTSQVEQYVESYRHMREHSNAYAIVVFEILFAPILVRVHDPRIVIPTVLVWLLPPACCWFIATALEVGLAHHE